MSTPNHAATEIRILTEGGFAFLEAPRWHEGRLWFSDMHGDAVWTVDESGALEKVVDVPNQASGLGWLPDGRLLVVSMTDRRILRLEGGDLVTHADLSHLGTSDLNDMWVDEDGRAYVGEMAIEIDEFLAANGAALAERGPQAFADADYPGARLFRVDVDGSVESVADDLRFPNGVTVTDEGRALVVCETFGLRLSRYDLHDGQLSNRRRQAVGFAPDGLSAPDTEGCVWAASPLGISALRISPDGEVLDQVTTNQLVLACGLGGSDGNTLFLMTSPTMGREATRSARGARIEAATVTTPLAGR